MQLPQGISFRRSENDLLDLYSRYVRMPFPESFLLSPALRRLKGVGMHCGMEYTSFPFYQDFEEYSRLRHSLGVALILGRFSEQPKEILSGLFHDIATPCFAHVIDFLRGDYQKQEATEAFTARIIDEDPVIQEGLSALGLTTDDVSDYHRYPIADNDSPRLSSDRLEYTLSNFLNYGYASLDEVEALYRDLVLTKNEDGVKEIAFQDPGLAEFFTLTTLKNSRVYCASEDRYGMEALARIVLKAIRWKVLTEEDLYTTEEPVIAKLGQDPRTAVLWSWYRGLYRVETSYEPSPFGIVVKSKKRFIDPLVIGLGRTSKISSKAGMAIGDFLALRFDETLVGTSKNPGSLPSRD